MSGKKKTTLFVIFSGPEQHAGSGTRYIVHDGSITEIRSQTASFYTFSDARRFAKEQGIPLTATTYIGLADITEWDTQTRG